MTDVPAAPASPLPQASWGLPLLAAASLLAAVPLGSTFFVLSARSLGGPSDDPYADEMGLGSLVSMAFNMGGWSMYAVLGAGVALSIISAVFVVFAARQNALFALPLPVFIAMPAAAGALGTNWGLSGAVRAVEHAAPADRSVILAGSMGEALWNSTLGACVAGGLALASCVALLLAGFAQARRAPLHARGLFAASVAALGLTVLAWFGATATQTGSSTWTFVAHGSPSAQQLAEVVSKFTSAQSRVAVVTLVLVVLSLGLAAVLGAKAGARVAFVVSLLLGVLLVSVAVRARPPKDFVAGLTTNEGARPPLYPFEAPRTGESTGIALEAEPRQGLAESIKQFRDLHAAASDLFSPADRFTFELRPNVSALALRTALAEAAQQGIRRVTLLTGTRDEGPTVPPPFDAFTRQARGVEVRLLFRESECPCDELKVEEKGVRLGDELWTFGPLEDKYADDYLPPVTLPLDEQLTVELVLQTANAAMAHDRRLGLLLEGGAPRRSSEFDDIDERLPPAVDVTVVDVKVLSGPMTAAELRRGTVLDSLRVCVADETLPRTIELEVALSDWGTVLGAMAIGAGEDDELARCASETADFTAVAEKLKGFSLVRVKYKFATAAPQPR